MIRDLTMTSAKQLSTPGSDEACYSETKDELLNSHYEGIYRSVVTKNNYLAADRPDIQYATKECARSMSAPTEGSWIKLKKTCSLYHRRAKSGDTVQVARCEFDIDDLV